MCHIETPQLRFSEFADISTVDALSALNDYISVAILYIEIQSQSMQLGRIVQIQCQRTIFCDPEFVELKEFRQNLFIIVAHGSEQYCRRFFLSAVDPHIKIVLGIKFEIQPRTPVRNHPAVEQQFAGRVRLAFVVVEEYAWRAVKLRYNNTFGSIDDERTAFCHERDLTDIDSRTLNHVLEFPFLVI